MKKAMTLHLLTKAMAIAELVYELYEHSHYSPDLAPTDFNLFPNFKNNLSGKHFTYLL